MLLSMNHPCSSCDGKPSVDENREALRGLEAQEDGIGRNDRHAEGEIHLQHPERLGVFLPLMLLGIPRLKHAAPAPRQVEMSPDGPVDFEYFRQPAARAASPICHVAKSSTQIFGSFSV